MIQELLHRRSATPEEILKAFDSLPVVEPAGMLGRWRGFEIRSGHRLDGLLEPSGWYGKLFESADEVHPLLFFRRDRKSLYAVNPALVPVTAPLPRASWLGTFMEIARPILQTKSSKARLRNVEFRGRMTATMIYDNKPIFDHFARIDGDRVLGIMDLKGVPGPYAFCLERDDSPIDIRL